jgi:hypothetical protein
MTTAPHNIQTAKTVIRQGDKIRAFPARHSDGSVTILIYCKQETVRVNFDTITEANTAGWDI